MKLAPFVTLGLLAHAFAYAQPAPEISRNGTISVGDTQWGTLYMDAKWRPSQQVNDFRPETSDGHQFKGAFYSNSGAQLFNLDMTLTQASPNTIDIQGQVTIPGGIETNMLCYQGTLPISKFAGSSVWINGNEVVLPEEFDKPNISIQQSREVSVPTTGGTLSFSGNFTTMIVDTRKFGGSQYLVRFFYSPHNGTIVDSTFSARMAFAPIEFTYLPLSAIANRTFVDEVEGDGKGGWTDQGPKLDLSAFAKNPKYEGSVKFDIPTTGNSVVVVSKEATRSDIDSAMLKLPKVSTAKYLYLLHASAYTWGKVGQIRVKYSDGSQQVIDIQNSRDVANWWNPTLAENAAVVWTYKAAQTNIGLYESRFELEGKPIGSITFSAVNDPVWMIVGATLTDQNIALPRPNLFEVKADKDWAKLDTPMTIQKGSVLDFSNWADAPAGKYGAVITTDSGHFAFEQSPNKPVRFFGANLNFSANFLSKEEADALALRLRQMGYNAVRIHHYDVLLAGGWNPESYKIIPEQLDKLDYLFHAMKQQGLYVSTDLFTIRRIRNDELSEFDGNKFSAFKALVPISEAAMNDWKRFSRDFLTHKNPYTGMTWAEDPALFSICPVNEDTIWAAINTDKDVKALYVADFEDWLIQNPRPMDSQAQRDAAFNEYLAGKQITADAEMRRFLKEDLGSKALVTGNNWKDYYAQAPIRAQYDYVDNHGYWDHPSFSKGPWKFPYTVSQRNATESLANLPRRLFLTRMDGLPFMITEFNYVYPNQFRAEGGPLMGAYSALQDYDGLFRFSWAHEREIALEPQAALGMDIAQDPIGQLTEYIIGMLWLRGDVPVLEDEAVFVVDKQLAFGDTGTGKRTTTAEDSVYKFDAIDVNALGKIPPSFKDSYSLLGLTRRISTRYEPNADSAELNIGFYDQQPDKVYAVQQGDASVQLHSDGDFLVQTPKSKAVVIKEKSLDESFVTDVSGGSVTVFAGALDDLPLNQSKHILVLHLTDVLCEGIKFGEQGKYSILDAGTAQKLVRRGSAEITLPNTFKNVTVYAVDLSGKRIGEMPVEVGRDGAITFTAETIAEGRAPVLAYEVIKAH